MKKNKHSITSLLRALLALFLVIGCSSFFQPCIHEDGNYGTCHYAGNVLIAMGIVMLLQAAIAFWSGNRGVKVGIISGAVLSSAAAFLIPGTLIPLCSMNTMRCNLIMKPAAMLIIGIYFLLSVVELIFLREEFRH